MCHWGSKIEIFDEVNSQRLKFYEDFEALQSGVVITGLSQIADEDGFYFGFNIMKDVFNSTIRVYQFEGSFLQALNNYV